MKPFDRHYPCMKCGERHTEIECTNGLKNFREGDRVHNVVSDKHGTIPEFGGSDRAYRVRRRRRGRECRVWVEYDDDGTPGPKGLNRVPAGWLVVTKRGTGRLACN